MSTIRQIIKKIGDWGNNIVSSIRARLAKFWVFRLAGRVLLAFSHDEASMRAGAITYYVLQSIFPLLLGLVSLFGFFLPYSSVKQAVFETLTRALPVSADFVVQILDGVIEGRGAIGIVSLLLLLWSGSNLFANIQRALNKAWNVLENRQFFIGKAIDLAMTAGAGILLLLSMFAAMAGQFFAESAGGMSLWVYTIGGRLIAFILTFNLSLLVYKYIPNTKTYWRWSWPGAFLVAVFFQLGTFVFALYITSYTNFQNVYGSLGSVIILLFWIYLSVEVLILGAELNSELQRMRLGVERVVKQGMPNANTRVDHYSD